MSRVVLESKTPIATPSDVPRAPYLARLRHRWLSVALVGVLSAAALGAWSQTASFRVFVLDGLALAYQVYDPAKVPHIEFGPQAAAATRLSAAQLAEQLRQWFPSYQFEVVMSPSSLSHEPPRFRHESLRHARSAQFRQAAQPILDASANLFQLAQQLRSLTRHGDAALPDMATDPLEYLMLAQRRVPLTCRYFAVIYGACAVDKGYTSRLIGLSRDGTSADHAVVEVYVPEQARWILFDPDFNIAYRRDQTWLNAAELHQTWLDLKARRPTLNNQRPGRVTPDEVAHCVGVEVVPLGAAASDLRETNLNSASVTGVNLEYFQHVLYHTGNDYLSAHYPIGHPDRGRQYVLQPPDVSQLPAICPEGELVTDLDALYFPVGRTALNVDAGLQLLEVNVTLSTWTPNFEHFETQIDHAGWESQETSGFAWQLFPGQNSLEARSVNLAGLRGETHHVMINVTTASVSTPCAGLSDPSPGR